MLLLKLLFSKATYIALFLQLFALSFFCFLISYVHAVEDKLDRQN